MDDYACSNDSPSGIKKYETLFFLNLFNSLADFDLSATAYSILIAAKKLKFGPVSALLIQG